MKDETVKSILVKRLDEGDRGDRGWFILTRVHVDLSWLKGIADYFEAKGAKECVELNDQDYQQLAKIIDSSTGDPSIQLRRHHLLVMDKPLQLLQRPKEPSWNEVKLTRSGRALALSDDPATVLEKVLSEIRFAATPWYSGDRQSNYTMFDVLAYDATKRVLEQCEGYIDRNEFDFFVSRIRRMDEVDWAVNAIRLYRMLSLKKQTELHSEVKRRIPGDKAYANWRDVGLHTFSLFSLGTSMVREGTRLRLTANWAASLVETVSIKGKIAAPPLKMPAPIESEMLLTPPAAPASNDGAEAESFVAKIFRSQGWTVAFYTNRRGFGFDLWARKGDAAIVIEVKSSVGLLGEVTLTENEYQAAREYRNNYVLALVEQLHSDNPLLRLIENPADAVAIVERSRASYTVSRSEWLRVTDR